MAQHSPNHANRTEPNQTALAPNPNSLSLNYPDAVELNIITLRYSLHACGTQHLLSVQHERERYRQLDTSHRGSGATHMNPFLKQTNTGLVINGTFIVRDDCDGQAVVNGLEVEAGAWSRKAGSFSNGGSHFNAGHGTHSLPLG
jgi:hypothetical protein